MNFNGGKIKSQFVEARNMIISLKTWSCGE